MDGSFEYSNEFGFHKILGNSWVAERLVASQEGLSSMEFVIINKKNTNSDKYYNDNDAVKLAQRVNVPRVSHFVAI
jgi:hypothetical protein